MPDFPNQEFFNLNLQDTTISLQRFLAFYLTSHSNEVEQIYNDLQVVWPLLRGEFEEHNLTPQQEQNLVIMVMLEFLFHAKVSEEAFSRAETIDFARASIIKWIEWILSGPGKD